MSNILFGTIKVRVGKQLIDVEKAVWTEGDSIYKAREQKFKETAYIVNVIESKVVGQVNKTRIILESNSN